MINKKPFQEIFNLYFHGKYSFEDFINTDIKRCVTPHQFNQKTMLSVNKKLAEFHKFINVFIINKLAYNSFVCFSYIENTTIRNCLEPHKNNKYFLSTDISNFFGSIQSVDVMNTIQSNINEGSLNISDIEKYKDSIIKLITFNDSLPIGFSTSGRLSNSILFKFDQVVLDSCNAQNITYSRYADDLIFSSNDKNIKQTQLMVENALAALFNKRLKINIDKTKIYSKRAKIKILGMTITPNGSITIDKKIKSDIELAMHFYAKNTEKFCSIIENKFDGNIQKAFGTVAYINSVDKAYLNKLRKKYGNYTVESFLRKSAKQ
ncbi:Retron-type RNA-directed DNA polymerase [uncultured Candidatus Thioglobus sp.]|nr:Retron-type RNA-directed DNA polymerase [uncultured Candidatus Thioglobus sp.]